jgi:hypothetical protein
MKYFIFLSLFISPIFSVAHAQDHEILCSNKAPLELFKNEMLNTILSLKQCPDFNEEISKSVKDDYNKIYGGSPQINGSVKGFNLQGTSEEIKLANIILGTQPPKEWDQAVSSCMTVLCAFTKLLKSEEAAMQLLNIPVKSGYALILDQKINQSKKNQIWSPEEIRELDAGIDKLPRVLRKLGKLSKIERMGDGLRVGPHTAEVAAYAVAAVPNKEAQLVYYDSGLRLDKTSKNPYKSITWSQEVLVHELCHHHDFQGWYGNYTYKTSEKLNAGFRSLSTWDEVTGKTGNDKWVHSEKASFVSDYARTSPAEDYAETCMNYVLHPSKLKKLAPEKYAYMKNNVFNDEEFQDKIWNKESWPKLNYQLADESQCGVGYNKCFNDIKKLEDGRFQIRYLISSSDDGFTKNFMTNTGDIDKLIKYGSCTTDLKNKIIISIEEELLEEKDFCERGGRSTINSHRNSVCVNTEEALLKSFKKISTTDYTKSISICEAENNFTYECVESNSEVLKDIPEAIMASAQKLFKSFIPNRIDAMVAKTPPLPSSKWIKSCLENISKISKFSSTDLNTKQDKVQFYYRSKVEGYNSGALGQNISIHVKDVNTKCAETMLDLYKHNNIKTPESDAALSLLSPLVKDEIISFENEVLGKIENATSKCLLSKCKENKILELLEIWSQNSTNRSDLVNEEFAKDLLSKF